MKLMVLAAFPHELKQILRNSKNEKKTEKGRFTIYVNRYLSHEVVAVQTGMGPFGPEDVLEEIMEEYRPDCMLSIGFGGALYEGAKTGELVWGEGFRQNENSIAVENKKVFKKLSGKLGIKKGTIITIERRTPKPELRKITGGLPFPVCDMETFYIARLALKRVIPFFAVRAITDKLDEEVPEELFGVCDESGNYSVTRALALLARKPGMIPGSIKLGRNSATASRNLWLAVKTLIEVLAGCEKPH